MHLIDKHDLIVFLVFIHCVILFSDASNSENKKQLDAISTGLILFAHPLGRKMDSTPVFR